RNKQKRSQSSPSSSYCLQRICQVSARSLPEAAQVSKAINSCAVSVCPARLQCITADQVEADQLKTFVGVGHMWTQGIAEHVRLAAACRAGARAPQQLKFQ